MGLKRTKDEPDGPKVIHSSLADANIRFINPDKCNNTICHKYQHLMLNVSDMVSFKQWKSERKMIDTIKTLDLNPIDHKY
jgi:hypothetical protein